ncbi:MAG: hypothetical protein OES34_13250 [Nitrosopumilus sp.]|nr:hypothetical protein [Nitrosopumilus sp.]
MAILIHPVCGNAMSCERQNMTGQTFDLYPWKDEKTCIVGEQ